MIVKKYPESKYLLGCYFHQDMFLDYENSDQALKKYVLDTPSEYIKLTLKEIEELKKEKFDSKKLDDFIDCLGCEYYYQGDNMTGTQWLDYIADTIRKLLKSKSYLKKKN